MKLRLSAKTVGLIEERLHRRGDLYRLVETVLAEVDWAEIVPYDRRFLHEAWGGASTNTSVSLPEELVQRLKDHAEKANTSPGRVVEGALLLWAAANPIDKAPDEPIDKIPE